MSDLFYDTLQIAIGFTTIEKASISKEEKIEKSLGLVLSCDEAVRSIALKMFMYIADKYSSSASSDATTSLNSRVDLFSISSSHGSTTDAFASLNAAMSATSELSSIQTDSSLTAAEKIQNSLKTIQKADKAVRSMLLNLFGIYYREYIENSQPQFYQ